MEEEDTQHTVSIHPSKLEWLPFCQFDESQHKGKEQEQHACRAHESLLLAYRTEDKVGILFGYELQFCLCAVEEPFSFQSSRADGYHTLMHVVARASQVILQTEQHIDTRALVLAQHVVEHNACRIEEDDGTEREQRHIEIVAHPCAECLIQVIADERGTYEQLHPHDVERDDIFGKEEKYHCDTQHESQDIESLCLVVAIDAHQCRREQLYEQEHHKLPL